MNLNLLTPINRLGYGIVGLNILRALGRLGHRVAVWPIGAIDVPNEDVAVVKEAIDRTHLFDANAPCLRIWHQFSLAERVGRGPYAALPIFELDRFTNQEVHHLKSVDFVCSPSHWGERILREAGVEATWLTPFGVDRTIFNELPTHEKVLYLPHGDGFINTPEGFTTFVNCGKWEVRKGHDFLLQAFNAAFTPADKVRLVMNCSNPFGGDAEWRGRYLTSPLGRAGKITVLSHRLAEQANVAALFHKCDVGVFPARAEGWNLDLLELLSCGKQAIATNYAGHTQFCTKENCRLISVAGLEKAEDGIWFKGQGNWAALGADELEQLVVHLRECHRLKQEGKLAVNQAGIDTAKDFSWDRTAEAIIQGFAP